jgi:hypothetical protein
VSYGENQDEAFLGMSVSRTQNASEATVQKIACRRPASRARVPIPTPDWSRSRRLKRACWIS